ncbi:MAG: cytochrome o ubiquinol oxidase subunit IV [Bacteroidota bacterium]|nr:cytochrome o ubiquinol oxidase subunit IV [Bacteroidota bacterium]
MSDTHGGGAHLTTKGYITGFILALILTLVSFGIIVFRDSVSQSVLYTVLFLAMTVQMLVHVHYFLHLDTSKAQRWNVIAIGFTAILLFIFIAGTMWVMYTLNSRMM